MNGSEIFFGVILYIFMFYALGIGVKKARDEQDKFEMYLWGMMCFYPVGGILRLLVKHGIVTSPIIETIFIQLFVFSAVVGVIAAILIGMKFLKERSGQQERWEGD